DDPELLLPQLLDEYREARQERLKDAPKSVQNAAGLVLCSLQKRLLSSIEAFACTLRVHRKAFDAQAAKLDAGAAPVAKAAGALSSALREQLLEQPGADDERGEASEEEVAAQEAAAMELATVHGMAPGPGATLAREGDLL